MFLKRAFLGVALTMLCAQPLIAQGVTTSAVAGTVVNAQGEPISGARITLVHQPTGSSSSVFSKADGRYAIPGLLPGGPYHITAQAESYAAQDRAGLMLTLSQTARVDFKLAVDAVELATFSIGGGNSADPIFTTGKTGASTVLSARQIVRFPSLSHDFTDFTRLVPQVSTRGSATIANGRNNRYNTIQIDGARLNDLFGLSASGTPGGSAGARPLPIEALQEFQVGLSPFDIRQGGFTGAGINAVTKSGSNDFEGTVGLYHRSQNLVGSYLVPGADTASAPLESFNNRLTAFSFGGPVVKNRIHFFVAGEMGDLEEPLNVVAGRTSTVSQASVDSVRNVLSSLYGFDAGEGGQMNLHTHTANLFGRMDVRFNDNHRMTFRHNLISAEEDNLRRSNSSYRLGASQYVLGSKTNSSVLQFNSVFGGRFFNEFRAGYTTVRDARTSETLFPALEVEVAGGAVYAGHERFSGKNALDQNILELSNDLNFTLGDHDLTVGTSNQFFSFSNLFVRNAYGYYEFDSIEDLIAGDASRYEYSYRCQVGLAGCSQEGKERAEFDVRLYSLFAQDQWNVSPTFTLTSGVRLDGTHFPTPLGHNPVVDTTVVRDGLPVRTTDRPVLSWQVNPRVAFNWDVSGEQTMQLRGGVGLFSGFVPGVWISNAYGSTGMDFMRFTCRGSRTPAFVADPQKQPVACDGSTRLSSSEINTLDPNFRMPQVIRGSLAMDKDLGKGFIATVEGIYTRSRSDAHVRELTVGVPTTEIAEGRAVMSRERTPFSNVTDLTSHDLPRSYSLTSLVKKSFEDKSEITAAYTYARSWDVQSITASQAYSNWRFAPTQGDPNALSLATSSFEIPHSVLVTAMKSVELVKGAKTDVALIYSGQSGRPFSLVYNGDVNGDGSRNNDLVYVPSDASEIRFGGSAEQQAASWAALDELISSTPCLQAARGSILSRNACREPWSNRVDLRVVQKVPALGSHNLQLTFDVLNLGNMLHRGWGLNQGVSNNTVPLLSVEDNSPEAGRVLMRSFRPTDLFQVNDLESRYQIQIGARYSF